ncbi:MAG: signal peptidase I [Acidimicrobiia bacterium]
MNPEDTGPGPTSPSTAPVATSIGFPSHPTSAPAKDGSVRNIVEWVVIIAVAVGFAFLVRGFAFQTFFIPSESMTPRLETDDRVLVNKFAYDLRDPSRGDVVVFRTPPNAHISNMDDLVKRIVGLPGETIEGRNGKILINGKVLSEPYLPSDLQSTTFGPAKVPANSYYMLGDNRQYSNDSTHWGPANRNLFVGPVFVTIWPLDRIDVPGWLWGIPIAIGFGTIIYLFVRRRDPDTESV